MKSDEIEDHELLYRVSRKSDPDCWENKKPMPAFFIDSKGASIDRDGNRSKNDIEIKFKNRFKENFGGLVRITAEACRNAETIPQAIHNHSNNYHGEIHNSETEIEIDFLKALQLADLCEIVCYNM